MSVKIRLAKVGRTHQISYRVAAQETRSKRDGKFLEILGYYNPYNKPELKIEKDRLDFWLKNGAKPTPAVKSLIKDGKLTKRPSKRKIAAKAKEKEEKTQKAEAAQTAAATAPASAPEPTTQTPKTDGQETPQADSQAEPEAPKEESTNAEKSADEKPKEQSS